MAQIELIMPKMGESIIEATILKWVKNVGDTVEEDETILEIATDKVDSEVPSPTDGVISKIFFKENDTVEIGQVIAIIATEVETSQLNLPTASEPIANGNGNNKNGKEEGAKTSPDRAIPQLVSSSVAPNISRTDSTGRFYSPLVRNIAKEENISMQELASIEGSGLQGRVTKKDILAYIEQRGQQTDTSSVTIAAPNPMPSNQASKTKSNAATVATSSNGNVEIVEMDRMRRLIADHMVMSKRTSPHVTSFVEVDVTNIVNWRNRIKADFQQRHAEKITYTPIFIEAVTKAIQDFPMVNVSVDGHHIIVKKGINIGMATALPSGNLIVPVIKNADQLNLLGLTKSVNDLASRARNNQLKPEEIQDGTFTLTNVGTFGNVMGTPIINQPQVAIMATGAIRKKPAVIETEYGDVIAIRQMMFLSLSYDHRVVDGFLGGSFLRKIGDYLEAFDTNRKI